MRTAVTMDMRVGAAKEEEKEEAEDKDEEAAGAAKGAAGLAGASPACLRSERKRGGGGKQLVTGDAAVTLAAP
jgi:hypothetical protein